MKLPATDISAAEIEEAIERLRDQSADFADVPERGLEMGDFAMIDFEGAIEGKPIYEIAPDASNNLHGGKKFWLHWPAKFSAEVLRTDRREKSERRARRAREFSRRFPGEGTGGKKAGLRGHAE